MNSNLIPITINNRLFQVRATASILQACEEASVDVPRFCYHEKLSVSGNCRMCLVEVEKSPKPVVSCAMPVSKNMVIYTDTPLVKKARESVLEFLLVNHPLDCPICDQAGECDLQDETLQYGSDRGRFFEFKRSVEDKECGPIVKTIMSRCIHCTRCVRFSAEIAGQETMGAFGRGQDTEIGTYIQSFIKTELSGNLVDLCPVGALTSKPYAFVARSWELQKVDSIDFFDGTCADILIQTRKLSTPQYENGQIKHLSKEEIVRILPRFNGLYSDNWISDKTRYAFDGLRKQRLNNPMIYDRKNIVKAGSWTDIFFDFTTRLTRNIFQTWENKSTIMIEPSRIAAVVESLVDVEGLYALNTALKLYGATDIQYGNVKVNLNIDAPFFYNLNRTFDSFDILNGLLIIGANPRFEASLLNTTLRKHQMSRALSYLTVGTFAQLKVKQTHTGNTVKSLVKFLENKESEFSKFYILNQTSLMVGVESLKAHSAFFIQNLVRSLGKKFFIKTKTGTRLSLLHANVTSLAFANLGLDSGVRSIFHLTTGADKKINNLFVVQPHELSSNKWLSTSVYTHVIGLSTHKASNIICDRLLPIKTFYEKDGYLFNIEGRLRKFYKAVTAPLNARSLESFFMALCRVISLPQDWVGSLNAFWFIENELPINNLIEKHIPDYFFNLLSYEEESFSAKNTLFMPAVFNFYVTDMISQNSTTMGECSLFLNENTNF